VGLVQKWEGDINIDVQAVGCYKINWIKLVSAETNEENLFLTNVHKDGTLKWRIFGTKTEIGRDEQEKIT
jgi:hypothetical protein